MDRPAALQTVKNENCGHKKNNLTAVSNFSFAVVSNRRRWRSSTFEQPRVSCGSGLVFFSFFFCLGPGKVNCDGEVLPRHHFSLHIWILLNCTHYMYNFETFDSLQEEKQI